jgi:hypothetical protein
MRGFWQEALWALAFYGAISGFMAILALAEQFQASPALPLLDMAIVRLTIGIIEWKFGGKRHDPNPLSGVTWFQISGIWLTRPPCSTILSLGRRTGLRRSVGRGG